MKIVLLTVYFGSPPSYFPLFLKSCAENSNINWLLIGDQLDDCIKPENVEVLKFSFSDFQNLVHNKFQSDFPIRFISKICDYKPAYGFLFEELISEYEWWGYCDLDQIFGNLDHFFLKTSNDSLQKLFCLGHLTLYRNTLVNNRVFMDTVNSRSPYLEVYQNAECLGFDEWFSDSINEIYISKKIEADFSCLGADIDPYRQSFSTLVFDPETKSYETDLTGLIFHWKQGSLFGLYLENGQLSSKEFPYIHLQKRQMKDIASSEINSDEFYIIPNRFILEESSPESLIRRANFRSLLNTQYLKVKISSLKKRIKTGNWKFRRIKVNR